MRRPTIHCGPRVDDDFGQVTDALALVHLIEDLILECWQHASCEQPIRSITAAGVGEDGLCVTKDLQPLGYSIPWFDDRATAEAEELSSIFDPTERTGIEIGPDRTASKWLWMHRHRPNDLTDGECWISLTDFPAAFWSGQSFMSTSLAPRTACYDLNERTWVKELLEACHAPHLPRVLPAGTPLGPIVKSRLLESNAVSKETVIAVGGHDHPVAASVIRAYDHSALVDSLGTANLLYGESSSSFNEKPTGVVVRSLPPLGGPTFSLLGVLEFAQAIGSINVSETQIREYLSQEVLPGEPPGSLSEIFVHAEDALTNLRRAIERECLKARDIVQVMGALGVPTDRIYSTGGWSRSKGFMELRASVFGKSLKIIDELELSALGAAQFGAKSIEGQMICILSKDDIKTISPKYDWARQYESI